MTEFGPNGQVISGGGPSAYAGGYAGDTKIRRIGLAVFLCGLCACFSVAALGFLVTAIIEISIGVAAMGNRFDDGILGGARFAALLATLNWVLFFITIPVSCLVIWLSSGRMPHRGITHRNPYLRWAAIWGAILVGATTTVFSSLEGVLPGLGGFLVGVPIGAVSGVVCGALFLAIVRPNTQLSERTVDAF